MSEPAPSPDLEVLRVYAELQLEGELLDEAAADVRGTVGLSDEEFTNVIFRLVTARYVTGGRTFASTYVDTVTSLGLAVASARTIHLDFGRYGSSEQLTARLYPAERAGLAVGDIVILAGDTVDGMPFTVTAIDDAGTDVTFRRLALPRR
jgi:hypothetical protein